MTLLCEDAFVVSRCSPRFVVTMGGLESSQHITNDRRTADLDEGNTQSNTVNWYVKIPAIN